MAMKPRTGRTRISKASEVVSEKAKEVLSRSDENLGTTVPARRRPDSKADDIQRKITSEAAPAVSAPVRRRPDSKADEIERKISPEVKPATSAPARRRPDSKADDIERKVPSAMKTAAPAPARRRPDSKADDIERKIPSGPSPAQDPVHVQQPQSQGGQSIPARIPGQKKSGCCLLPFVLGLAAAAGLISVIF